MPNDPQCVWRDGCRAPSVCRNKGYCDAPPAMRREALDANADKGRRLVDMLDPPQASKERSEFFTAEQLAAMDNADIASLLKRNSGDCDFHWRVREAVLNEAARRLVPETSNDSARLDWVTRHVSGSEWRRLGVLYGDTDGIRHAIDVAMGSQVKAICDCPEVCPECGGRAKACAILGHRRMSERSIKWHECPAQKTPAPLTADPARIDAEQFPEVDDTPDHLRKQGYRPGKSP